MFTPQPGQVYRMPVSFGGHPYVPTENAYHDVTSMMATIQTERSALEKYVPAQFELLRPEFSITFAQNRQIDWLAGGAYNLVDIGVPVRFHGAIDDVMGTFSLVTWENLTDPILGGREANGVAKIFCDIQDLRYLGDERNTVLSYQGNTFLRFGMTVSAELPDETLAKLRHTELNSMHWRYIPSVGGPGADLSQIVLYPQRSEMDHAWRVAPHTLNGLS